MNRDELLKRIEELEQQRINLISSAQFQIGQIEGQVQILREMLGDGIMTDIQSVQATKKEKTP